MRRARFLELGGFDAEAYNRPCIEDIEFGLRLHDAGGRILLDPTIQGTHHKRWTLGLMVYTDIRQRAIPWSQLLLQRRQLPATLNLSTTARLSAGICLVLPVALLAAASPTIQPWALLAFVGCLALFLLLNRVLLTLLWRQGGLRLFAVGPGLLMLYQFYSFLSLAAVTLVTLASAPVRAPDWLKTRPALQQRLARAGLTLLGLLALAYFMRGLLLLGTMDQGGYDLLQRFDEWRLFRNGIYPAGDLADRAARLLPYFRTTVYLPWALPQFGILFGWGGFGQGKLVISALSLAALAMMAVMGRRILSPLGRRAGWLGFLTPLAIYGNSTCLALGQFSILCMGLISMQFWLLQGRRPVAAGVCWALAMLKPQLALPYALPLLKRRNRIGLVMGIGLLLTLSAIALLHTHVSPISLGISWLKVLPSFQGKGNVNALAAVWPLLTSTAGIALMAVLLTILMLAIARLKGRLRHWTSQICTILRNAYCRADPLELAGLCGVVALLAFYNRVYDQILLFPAVLALCRAALHQLRWGQFVLTVLMALSVWSPPKLLYVIPAILPIQSLIWALCGAWLLLRLLDQGRRESLSV